jgi:hypothetical protein
VVPNNEREPEIAAGGQAVAAFTEYEVTKAGPWLNSVVRRLEVVHEHR